MGWGAGPRTRPDESGGPIGVGSRRHHIIEADHGVPPSDATGSTSSSSSSSQASVALGTYAVASQRLTWARGPGKEDVGKRWLGARSRTGGNSRAMSRAAGLVRSERGGLCMHGGQQEAWQKVVFTWWRRASQQRTARQLLH